MRWSLRVMAVWAVTLCSAAVSTAVWAGSAAGAGGSVVQVYFSERSATDFRSVSAVRRTTNRVDVARFAMQQLIAGPTRAERARGLYADLGRLLTGPSDCGSDFRLEIAGGAAVVRFCRQLVSRGVGDDVRTLSQIEATLAQFRAVQRVVVLDRRGRCLGDESGRDRCRRDLPPRHRPVPAGGPYPVAVYFADPMRGPGKVTAARRLSPRLGVARFALDRLIAGPTAAERGKGLRGGLRESLVGASNCGRHFTLAISRRVATVRFCRYVNVTTGSMDVAPQVEATLLQFRAIRRVVMLGPDGRCTFTQKDGDPCLGGL